MNNKCLFLMLALLPMAGCSTAKPFRIEPVQAKGETVLQPQFQSGYYYADRDRDLHFVLQAKEVQGVRQVAIVRVFWRPVAGKTPIRSSALNATIRYLVLTPNAVGMYEGAGFIRLHAKTGAPTMTASIEDADLRLTQASAGFNDALGRSRVRGNFSAELEQAQTVSLSNATQREFFSRSLAVAQSNK